MKRVILALLLLGATVLIWFLGERSGRKAVEEKQAIAELFVRHSISSPLEAFRRQVGRYPATEEGLAALIASPKGVEPVWHGPYVMGNIPLDPWGRPYRYRCPAVRSTSGYDVWSLGADPVSDVDDIGNWSKQPAPP